MAPKKIVGWWERRSCVACFFFNLCEQFLALNKVVVLLFCWLISGWIFHTGVHSYFLFPVPNPYRSHETPIPQANLIRPPPPPRPPRRADLREINEEITKKRGIWAVQHIYI